MMTVLQMEAERDQVIAKLVEQSIKMNNATAIGQRGLDLMNSLKSTDPILSSLIGIGLNTFQTAYIRAVKENDDSEG